MSKDDFPGHFQDESLPALLCGERGHKSCDFVNNEASTRLTTTIQNFSNDGKSSKSQLHSSMKS